MKTVLPAAGLSSIPSALMTFRTGSRTPHVLAAAWVGVICSRPAVLSITLRGPLPFSGKWPAGGEFAINLPSDEQMASPRFIDLLARVRPGIGPGMSFEAGAATGAPLLCECPVRIECRRATIFSRLGQDLVSGEVAAVHMEGRIYGLDGPVDFCRLRPFATTLGEAGKNGFDGIIPPGMEAGFLSGAPS